MVTGDAAQRDHLAADGDLAGEDTEVQALDEQPGADLVGPVAQDRQDLFLLRGADDDGVRVDDPGLFGRDLLDGVAEEVLVVDADGRDDRDVGLDDIGRVPGAAHADLDDGHVDRRVREGRVGERDEHLEVGHPRPTVGDRPGVDRVDEGSDVGPRVEEGLAGDQLAADGDPLADVLQVRRGEAPRLQARLPQHRLDDPRRRRLAVGPGDVDDGEGALRLAEQVHDRADPVEARLEVVLGSAGEDAVLDLAHALAQLEGGGGLPLGGVGGGTHAPDCRTRQPSLRARRTTSWTWCVETAPAGRSLRSWVSMTQPDASARAVAKASTST